MIRAYVLEDFVFTDDGHRLREDASFLEKGMVDSTGVLELVIFVEERFGFAVEDEGILPENFDPVAQLAGYVRRKKEKMASLGVRSLPCQSPNLAAAVQAKLGLLPLQSRVPGR